MRRFSAALSSRCQIVRKVLPRTGSCHRPGSAQIIRALIISALMIGAQQCTLKFCPPVTPSSAPTCATQQCPHLCHPVVPPPVPPSSATHLCPVVPPTSQQCCQSVPRSDASQCHLSV
ncbi:unnamed protein product, partial [Staurois parvus]